MVRLAKDTVLIKLSHFINKLNTNRLQEVNGNQGKVPFSSGEEQYHRMVEEVEDYAILLLDSQGIIRNWNKGAEKIKGYTTAEIVGHHFRIFYTEQDKEAGLPERL